MWFNHNRTVYVCLIYTIAGSRQPDLENIVSSILLTYVWLKEQMEPVQWEAMDFLPVV